MSEPMVAYHNGSWACYTTPDGIRRRYVGCSHRLPRAAIAHRANLEGFVSPLRASGVGLAPIPSPQPRSGSLSLTPDELRGRPRSARTG